MAKVKMAVQLYSVREDCAKDFPGVLADVAKMGYEGVEFAGYYDRTSREIRKMLDDLGLKVAGTHIGVNTLLGEELAKSIDFNLEIGNRFLIVPGLPEEMRNSIAAWQKTAALFNDLATKLAPHGLRVGYHNHSIEFAPMDGLSPWDTFFGSTSPDVVMQLDMGNAMHGQADVVAILKRYMGRATTVHLKEFSATHPLALVGEGDVPWAQVFALCEVPSNTEWYIVEQEVYSHPPLECIEICLKALRAMGK